MNVSNLIASLITHLLMTPVSLNPSADIPSELQTCVSLGLQDRGAPPGHGTTTSAKMISASPHLTPISHFFH